MALWQYRLQTWRDNVLITNLHKTCIDCFCSAIINYFNSWWVEDSPGFAWH